MSECVIVFMAAGYRHMFIYVWEKVRLKILSHTYLTSLKGNPSLENLRLWQHIATFALFHSWNPLFPRARKFVLEPPNDVYFMRVGM